MNLIKKDPSDIVAISKNFVHSAFNLNMQSQRILMLVFKKVGEYKKENKGNSFPVMTDITITVDEYREAFHPEIENAKNKIAYKALTESSVEFQKSLLVLKMPNGDYKKYNFTSEGEYLVGEGKVIIKLNPIIALVIGTIAPYAKLPFSVYKQFKNKYSLRFLLYITEFADTQWVEIKIDDLKKMLMLDKQYKLTGNIVSRIITPAIEEIKECTGLKIKTEYKRKGRKIDSVKFTFGKIFNASRPKFKPVLPAIKKPTVKTKEFTGLAKTADEPNPLLKEYMGK